MYLVSLNKLHQRYPFNRISHYDRALGRATFEAMLGTKFLRLKDMLKLSSGPGKEPQVLNQAFESQTSRRRMTDRVSRSLLLPYDGRFGAREAEGLMSFRLQRGFQTRRTGWVSRLMRYYTS
jgi:hypothetical protein